MTVAALARPRLLELARRFSLPVTAATALERLVELLADDPLAPTTVREPLAIVDRHIADALCALEVAPLDEVGRIADVGSGAGLPGLPLALGLPRAQVFLVESSRRKCEFLERAVAAMEVENAHVVHCRAEEWSEGSGHMDLTTARAVAPPATVLEYAAPLLRHGGMCLDWRAGDPGDSREAAAAAATVLGMELTARHAVKPFPAARDLYIDLYVKVRDTPDRFPRRPGMARKRPLAP